MESIKEIVCGNCKRLLDDSVNLAELARLMQVSPSTVSRWKSGAHAPELEKIDRLSKILRISPLEFYKVESAPQERPISLSEFTGRLSAIPDDIFEDAQKLGGAKSKYWENVRLAMAAAILIKEEDEESKKKNAN